MGQTWHPSNACPLPLPGPLSIIESPITTKPSLPIAQPQSQPRTRAKRRAIKVVTRLGSCSSNRCGDGVNGAGGGSCICPRLPGRVTQLLFPSCPNGFEHVLGACSSLGGDSELQGCPPNGLDYECGALGEGARHARTDDDIVASRERLPVIDPMRWRADGVRREKR